MLLCLSDSVAFVRYNRRLRLLGCDANVAENGVPGKGRALLQSADNDHCHHRYQDGDNGENETPPTAQFVGDGCAQPGGYEEDHYCQDVSQ